MEQLPGAVFVINNASYETAFVSAGYQTLFARDPESMYRDSSDWIRAVHPQDLPQASGLMTGASRTSIGESYRVVHPHRGNVLVEHRVVPSTSIGSLQLHYVREIPLKKVALAPDDLEDELPVDDTREILRAEVDRLLAQNAELQEMQHLAPYDTSMFRDLARAIDAIILLVKAGRVIYANPVGAQALGRPSYELPAIPLAELFGSAVAMRIVQAVEHGFRDQLVVGRPDGSVTTIDVSVQPLQLGNFSVTFIMGVDVSEQFERSARMAEELNNHSRLVRSQLFSQLYARLAHELNQPLTSIVAYGFGVSTLLQSSGADPELSDSVQRMVSEAERAGAIVRKLRDLFGEPDSEQRPIEVVGLVGHAVELMETELARQRIDLQRRSQCSDHTVLGDPAQLEVIVLNLLRNAIKAVVARGEPRWIRVTCSVQGDNALIEVVDPGVPFPEHQRLRLLESPLNAESSGNASSIYLCRRIAHKHGGVLHLVPDRDLKIFRLVLPLHVEPT